MHATVYTASPGVHCRGQISTVAVGIAVELAPKTIALAIALAVVALLEALIDGRKL